MANFEGLPLFGDVTTPGALYPLRTAPEFSGAVRLSTGEEVEVREGVKAVAVRGIAASNYESVTGIAPELANQGLDIFTLKGRTPLALQDVENGHVAWWSEGQEAVIRFWCSSTITAAIRVTAEVRGPDGRLKPPDPENTPQWQESMRYYRMSELTDDLFDACRNVYLALESLLSWLHPKLLKSNGRPESDEDWFKRALKAEGRSVDLQSFSIPSSGNPVHDIYDELHNRIRNRIFHAKGSLSYVKAKGAQALLPQRLADRSEVANAKERYGRLYLVLAEEAFDAKFPSGGSGLSKEGARRMLGAITQGWNVAFTGDPTPADSSDSEISPNGEAFINIPGRGFTDSRGDEYVAVIADARLPGVVGDVSSVGRMATVSQDGALGAIYSLEGRLDLEGFDRCEFVFSFHVAGQRARKTRYAT
ncbi:hypothetical protein ABZ953_23400 [Streptomyces sp. NPDC046465]|uniref:hypothetical protein n=1 Tax=Streptomyces sp. NPDC046465 TaxID=3155810 RepID=UPI0033C06654